MLAVQQQRALTQVSVVIARQHLRGDGALLGRVGHWVWHCLAGQHRHLRRGGLHRLLPCNALKSSDPGQALHWTKPGCLGVACCATAVLFASRQHQARWLLRCRVLATAHPLQ